MDNQHLTQRLTELTNSIKDKVILDEVCRIIVFMYNNPEEPDFFTNEFIDSLCDYYGK